MGYPDGYTPKAPRIAPPSPEAHPAICVCVDILRAYELGAVSHAEMVAVMGEWLPQVPLGPAHGTFVARMAEIMRDRIAMHRQGIGGDVQ
jgi:hypothetical protein